eukprot:TRINITY_DN2394_c0_g1_i3.p1 TRINITY_DN2394_c0_g1~~TRINITY_DN2394_c0_g1_i3.p1  ORF type:complete len:361 (-),score=80.61 TRINITY_DN2394_c0_g1_i3:267-1349(-)
MGCCGSSLSEAEKADLGRSQQIDDLQNIDKSAERKIVKLLLLGTGESGKTTVLKQMHVIYAQGFNATQREQFRSVIRKNLVEGLQTLVAAVKRYRWDFSSAEAEQVANEVAAIDVFNANFWTQEIDRYVRVLWGGIDAPGDPAIKQAFENRSKFQMTDSAVYFFDNVARIREHDYIPSDSDILRARLRTTGIVENSFRIEGVEFKFLDVGGQRNERRKWIHCFQDVTAIIFITAISEYDQVLWEDEKQNRLIESLKVFEDICNKPYFKNTAMILFLNKVDIFEDKIQTKDLQCCFPEYAGGCDFEFACSYIRERFIALNRMPKDVYTHFTCATDTENISRVFNDCRKIIVKKNLAMAGLN